MNAFKFNFLIILILFTSVNSFAEDMSAKSKFSPSVEKNLILGVNLINGMGSSDIIQDSSTRVEVMVQFFPESSRGRLRGGLIKGLGTNLFSISNTHKTKQHREAISNGTGFGAMLYLNHYLYFNHYIIRLPGELSVGYQIIQLKQPVKFGMLQNNNTLIQEAVASWQFSDGKFILGINYYRRVGNNLPVNGSAIGIYLGIKF